MGKSTFGEEKREIHDNINEYETHHLMNDKRVMNHWRWYWDRYLERSQIRVVGFATHSLTY